MPIIYEYNPICNFIRAKAKGILTVDDLLDYLDKVLTDTRIPNGFVEIVDFEDVQDISVSFAELFPFKNILLKYREKGCKRIIIYAPTEISYDIFFMFKSSLGLKDLSLEPLFTVCRTKLDLDLRSSELCA